MNKKPMALSFHSDVSANLITGKMCGFFGAERRLFRLGSGLNPLDEAMRRLGHIHKLSMLSLLTQLQCTSSNITAPRSLDAIIVFRDIFHGFHKRDHALLPTGALLPPINARFSEIPSSSRSYRLPESHNAKLRRLCASARAR
jgi:hypothetical protein